MARSTCASPRTSIRRTSRARSTAPSRTALWWWWFPRPSTQETMANAQAAKAWGARNFIAVTANVALAKQLGAQEIFPMWDWVGGRFSVWSAVGFAAMCAIGPDAFQQFLDGAREVDGHFAQAPLEKNVPVLMALVGAWNVNFLGIPTHAVLPYANALRLLPRKFTFHAPT